MIDTVALTGIYGNGPPNDDVGNPPDPEYAKLMWKWIEKTLSEVDFSTLSVIQGVILKTYLLPGENGPFFVKMRFSVRRIRLFIHCMSLYVDGCIWIL